MLGLFRLGGARYSTAGRVATDGPGIIVMNHQSVLDIPVVITMASPIVPGFVARARYARAPVIGTGLRLADCPVIDPRRDRDAALTAMRRAVRQDRTLLVYPEAHRTPDGELQPFRTAGLRAMLEERRVPVWLVATDGFCAGRKLVDFVFNVPRIDGRTEVVGRYEAPADAADLDAFLARLEDDLRARLRAMRQAAAERAVGRRADTQGRPHAVDGATDTP